MSKILTSRQYLKQLNIMFFAQAGVLLFFTAIIYGVVTWGKVVPASDPELTDMLTYVLMAVIVICFSSAHFAYQVIINKIDHTLPLPKKMPRYLGPLLIRSAMLEVPGLFASIVFFLSGNIYLLLIPIFVAIVFFLLRPTADGIAQDMRLSPEETALLKNPDAIVADATREN